MNIQDMVNAQQQMAVFKMARNMLQEELTVNKNTAHEVWIVESEKTWREKGEILPYPTVNTYPSESDILAKAASIIAMMEENKNPPVANESAPTSAPEAVVESSSQDVLSAQANRESVMADRIKNSAALSTAFYSVIESPWNKYLVPPEKTDEKEEVQEKIAPMVSPKPDSSGLQGPPITYGPLASTSPIKPITESQHNAAIVNV